MNAGRQLVHQIKNVEPFKMFVLEDIQASSIEQHHIQLYRYCSSMK